MKEWHTLTSSEQSEWFAKARWLLDRGYVLDTTEEELAMKMFYASLQKVTS